MIGLTDFGLGRYEEASAAKAADSAREDLSDMVAEHIDWAIRQLKSTSASSQNEKVIPVNL